MPFEMIFENYRFLNLIGAEIIRCQPLLGHVNDAFMDFKNYKPLLDIKMETSKGTWLLITIQLVMIRAFVKDRTAEV